MQITFKNYTIVIEEDGKPLREDLKPLEIAQGQWVKLQIFDSAGTHLATADKFGYTTKDKSVKSLSCPFTNMQCFIQSYENPTQNKVI